MPLIKILMVGEQKTGKTALYRKLKNDKQPYDNNTQTVNVDFAVVNREIKSDPTHTERVNFQIWDLGGEAAGETKFPHTVTAFYSGSDIVIVMLDATKSAAYKKNKIENCLKVINNRITSNATQLIMIENIQSSSIPAECLLKPSDIAELLTCVQSYVRPDYPIRFTEEDHIAINIKDHDDELLEWLWGRLDAVADDLYLKKIQQEAIFAEKRVTFEHVKSAALEQIVTLNKLTESIKTDCIDENNHSNFYIAVNRLAECLSAEIGPAQKIKAARTVQKVAKATNELLYGLQQFLTSDTRAAMSPSMQKLHIKMLFAEYNKKCKHPTMQRFMELIAVIIITGLGLFFGAAVGVGVGILAGAWSGPGVAITATTGLFSGAATGATVGLAVGTAVTGVSAAALASYFFFKPTPVEKHAETCAQAARQFIDTQPLVTALALTVPV